MSASCHRYNCVCDWREPAGKGSPGAWSCAGVSCDLQAETHWWGFFAFFPLSFCYSLEAKTQRRPESLTTQSHFPLDRKKAAVFLYKFGFATGRRKSQLVKVSLRVSNYLQLPGTALQHLIHQIYMRKVFRQGQKKKGECWSRKIIIQKGSAARHQQAQRADGSLSAYGSEQCPNDVYS